MKIPDEELLFQQYAFDKRINRDPNIHVSPPVAPWSLAEMITIARKLQNKLSKRRRMSDE